MRGEYLHFHFVLTSFSNSYFILATLWVEVVICEMVYSFVYGLERIHTKRHDLTMNICLNKQSCPLSYYNNLGVI